MLRMEPVPPMQDMIDDTQKKQNEVEHLKPSDALPRFL